MKKNGIRSKRDVACIQSSEWDFWQPRSYTTETFEGFRPPRAAVDASPARHHSAAAAATPVLRSGLAARRNLTPAAVPASSLLPLKPLSSPCFPVISVFYGKGLPSAFQSCAGCFSVFSAPSQGTATQGEHKQNQNETREAFKGWIKHLAEIQRVPSFTSSQFGALCVTPIKLAQLKSRSGASNLHSSRSVSAARGLPATKRRGSSRKRQRFTRFL